MTISFQLTPKEAALVYEILESYLSDLREEISDTDDFDFRSRLKEKEDSLKDLLKRLEGTKFMVVA